MYKNISCFLPKTHKKSVFFGEVADLAYFSFVYVARMLIVYDVYDPDWP